MIPETKQDVVKKAFQAATEKMINSGTVTGRLMQWNSSTNKNTIGWMAANGAPPGKLLVSLRS